MMKAAQITEHEFNQLYRAYTDLVYEKEPLQPEQLQMCNDVDQVLEILADRLFYRQPSK